MRKHNFLFILAILFTMNVMAQNIPSYVPKDGLVGYWPFNGNANDESGNGNHGTVNGATLTADRNGVVNSAYSFGEKYDVIRIKDNETLDLSDNYTISTWIKTDSNSYGNIINYGTIIGKWGSKFEAAYLLSFSPNGNIYYCTHSSENTCITTNNKLEFNSWYHIVISQKNDKLSVYLNNEKIGFYSDILKPSDTKNDLIFGSNDWYNLTGTGDDFYGKLDDICIYNRALSEQEITALYTGNPITQNIPSYVPKNGLVGYWPFNGNANDESGNGNHGTVNGTTLTTDRNGVANSAYSFDGIDNYIKIDNNLLSENKISSYSINLWLFANDFKSDYSDLISDRSDKDYAHKYRISCSNNSLKQPGTFLNMMGDGYGETHVYDKTYFYTKTWTNYIVTFDTLNKEMKCYKNGVLVDRNNSSGIGMGYPLKNSATYFGLSISPAGVDNGFNGQIDDIAIYNRALSEQEISQLYAGCSKETATSSSFNSLLFTNGSAVSITAEPQGGVFTGSSIENNLFIPSKAKIGSNKVKYNFKNSQGCADSTVFTMVIADTVGTICTKYDTVKVNKYDTVKVTKFDTITVTNNVTKYDTVKVSKFDTITVTNNVTKYDTVKVNKYDTITITNKVTKYDTVLVNKTKYDTVIVKTNVFDTVKVTKYDTLTITNNVTKYDTVKVTKFDTITITNNVTKYDTVKVTKFDTITNNVTKYDTVIVNKTNYDTVSILKIKFKLTTGIHANKLSSLSIYPNPTSDVLHIEVPDAKALEGYRFRIVDALGKEVYNQLVTQTTTEIPLKTLGAAGIYQFEILDAKNVSIQSNKIVLQ